MPYFTPSNPTNNNQRRRHGQQQPQPGQQQAAVMPQTGVFLPPIHAQQNQGMVNPQGQILPPLSYVQGTGGGQNATYGTNPLQNRTAAPGRAAAPGVAHYSQPWPYGSQANASGYSISGNHAYYGFQQQAARGYQPANTWQATSSTTHGSTAPLAYTTHTGTVAPYGVLAQAYLAQPNPPPNQQAQAQPAQPVAPVTTAQAANAANNTGVPQGPGYTLTRWTDPELARAKQMRATGRTTAQIAAALHKTPAAVTAKLWRDGGRDPHAADKAAGRYYK